MIKYSDSFLKFLSDAGRKGNRIAYYLYKAHEHWRYREHLADRGTPDTHSSANAFKLMLTGSELNYLTFRKDGSISYLPKGKPHIVTEDGAWSKEGRQFGKAAKVIRRLFTPKALKLFKDTHFEEFSNIYKSTFGEEGLTFELLPATKIGDIYRRTRIKDGGGSLGSSCMNKDYDYFGIYENCKQLQILCLWDENRKLAGRCLVWTMPDFILCDRFYVVKDYMYDLFKEYATEKGWCRKWSYKTYEDKQHFVNPQGQRFEAILKVETPTNFDWYPYIDTFTWGNEGWISNSDKGCTYIYSNTGGSRNGGARSDSETMIEDDITGDEVRLRETVLIQAGENAGLRTHRDNAVAINNVWYWKDDENGDIWFSDWNGNWYLIEDKVHSNYMKMDLPKSRSRFSRFHNDWIHIDRCICYLDSEGREDFFHRNERNNSFMQERPGNEWVPRQTAIQFTAPAEPIMEYIHDRQSIYDQLQRAIRETPLTFTFTPQGVQNI